MSAAADKAPLKILFIGPPTNKVGSTKRKKKKEVAQACRLKGPVAHLVVGERRRIFFKTTEGSLPKAADRALSLKSTSAGEDSVIQYRTYRDLVEDWLGTETKRSMKSFKHSHFFFFADPLPKT